MQTLIPPNLSTTTREELRRYFENTYDSYEKLWDVVKDPSSMYLCPDRLRLPLIFYLGHTSAVYVNKMMLAGMIKERVNLEFETLLETGVDEYSWDDTEHFRMGGAFRWPAVEDVWKYRDNVRKAILEVIETMPLELPINMDSPWWSLVMGTEHERIHLETSSVLIRQLPIELVQPVEGWKMGPTDSSTASPPLEFVQLRGETVYMGKPTDFPTYGWDNEYGLSTVAVADFEVTPYPITNGQFLEFVESGGYRNRTLWTEEGWRWVEFRHASHPTFWVCTQGCLNGCGSTVPVRSHCRLSSAAFTENSVPYKYRSMTSIIELPLDWPVDVNYHEALAFCHWLGNQCRMPSEAEYHVMRGITGVPEQKREFENIFSKNNAKPIPKSISDKVVDKCPLPIEHDILYYEDGVPGNLNLAYCSSTPVTMYPPNSKGLYDIWGNVWEWTEDHFNGLDGFSTHHLYDDFSTPTFDGLHNLILGGSWASSGDEASVFARYAFRRHFFQHCGFRVVRPKTIKEPNQVRLVKEWDTTRPNPITVPGITDANFHPSTHSQYQCENDSWLAAIAKAQLNELSTAFSATYVQRGSVFRELLSKYVSINKPEVLEIGAGLGATTYTYADKCKSVLGIDPVGYFVRAAQSVLANGSFSIGEHPPVAVSASENREALSTVIRFIQLSWLPNEVGFYDAVLVNNLFSRVTCPEAWLRRLPEIVRPGGILVLILGDPVEPSNIEVQPFHPTSASISPPNVDAPPIARGLRGAFVHRETMSLADNATCIVLQRPQIH